MPRPPLWFCLAAVLGTAGFAIQSVRALRLSQPPSLSIQSGRPDGSVSVLITDGDRTVDATVRSSDDHEKQQVFISPDSNSTFGGRSKTNPASPLKGHDLDGRLHRIGESDDCRTIAIVFLGIQCPISNGAIPGLIRLRKEYSDRGVEFFGVLSTRTVTRDEARAHSSEYSIDFPVLFDVTSELREKLGATHTPHAILLSANGIEQYSGAIDDQYAEVGRKRVVARSSYLKDAIDDVLAGRIVRTPRTMPVGCLLEQRDSEVIDSEVTFSREIAPVIFENCTTCHRNGSVAPFPLESYHDVVRHARQIRVMVELKLMPPWKPESGFGRFRNEMRLSQREIDLFGKWVDAGLPEGKQSEMPDSPRFADGWQLGTPDLVLEVDEPFQVPADGNDIYQYFVIPTGLTEDRLVSAVEYQPGNAQVVHHASFRFDDADEARRLDREFPGPGYQRFGGWGFSSGGTLGGWAVGVLPQHMPSGFGRPIRAASDFVIQTHYHPSGRAVQDQARVGLYFAPKEATTRIAEIFVANLNLHIPPNDKQFIHQAEYTLPVDTTLHAVLPHMHLLGRRAKAEAFLPEGRKEPLILIDDWDFKWQGQYFYNRPLKLPAGTRIVFDVEFDNSTFNPQNPHLPPRWVHWGEESTAEMAVCFFDVSADTNEQLERLIRHNRESVFAKPSHDHVSETK